MTVMMVLLENLSVWYLVVLHLALQLIVTASLLMIDNMFVAGIQLQRGKQSWQICQKATT